MDKLKKYNRLKILFFLLTIVLSYAPALALVCNGMAEGEPGEQFALGSSIIFAIVMAAIQFKTKNTLRSIIWVLMIGAYCCLDNIIGYIMAIAVCTLLDELIATPMYKYFKKRYDMVLQAKEVYDYGQSVTGNNSTN